MSLIELSLAEENYLKSIYHLYSETGKPVSTNAIAEAMNTRAASVTDMLKRLASKKLISYKKYYGVMITESGTTLALRIIRKHRLWETFLVEKLRFNWDEVHEVAEQLEHIQSQLLIKRLDEYLGSPRFDPHGDPIPTEDGEIADVQQVQLLELRPGEAGKVTAVRDTSSAFLQYLDKTGISIGSFIRIVDQVAYDNSLEIRVNDTNTIFISQQVAGNLWVQRVRI
ncbi:metal-dependent transcriptional regulator [Fulvivirga sedimenti]|uniref:Transcriptional regulator MntR n=1 Tax=Fulvivirga sedimenti TaxID=2879465 RepID=A0A9X1HTD1_9BACT|nr:metal-dependent transcriptional regulator [Fulvivirga sedimenti]MCA6074625.1 metal-dependent transcriptional regulator [Fulvivirga sedimenti]MCA6075802.1 metal-dependent transcriptional regulator [Fulvivirga sedimenti]MCA6076930.1 metal-dependent transcriptional regulator [Fulvivirga sedimenti]